MSDQSIVPARSSSVSFSRAAWLLASLVPAIFLLCFLALASYAAPEHDDFCFLSQNLHDGFVHTVLSYYNEWSGRVVPFLLIQFPSEIAKATGINIVPAYAATLASFTVVFIAATAFAVVRAWPGLPVQAALFLSLAFPAAIIAAAPSLHVLLYWLPGLTCYVPPRIISALVLGEVIRALGDRGGFSWPVAVTMAIGGLVAATCNEFTAVWLFGIVASSLLARRYLGRELQVGHHVLVAAAVLIGWVIILSAPGNSARLAATGGIHDVLYVAPRALNYAVLDLGRFISCPSVVAWCVVAGAVTLAEPESRRPALSHGGMLASRNVVLCLACCYFEYFMHHLTTGVRLVERAQNQALILLFFGLTLSTSLLVRTYRRDISRYLAFASSWSLDSVALPAALAGLFALSLYGSQAAVRLRAEREAFYPFWQESVARYRLLATRPEPVVAVPEHKWRPSVIMAADLADSECLASYFGKSRIIPAERAAP